MITCDFAILPVGTETTECKDYVTAAVQAIKDSGLSYQLTGMGTQIEADNLEELYAAIAKAQEAVFEVGVGRVYTVIKIDDRRDLDNRTLDAKVDTVNEMLK
ncbi:MTH1187 family thiamine-binding protein [uncultured Methanobrevibacter sp.]|uniref:MTH1187 family thiamine-binding protein n=1 Tax=uncultured Methanobrevibacter sp. TaxID=253161 RepID=UPI0025F6098D|nr:MTH1187 family thiamine-binding protein [uncultured Methanobrevibacter sp.]MDO5810329.1 MTH1187 family thiamine-binding protein [Methanobrevibacter sp.]